jgi:hypothetical protein
MPPFAVPSALPLRRRLLLLLLLLLLLQQLWVGSVCATSSVTTTPATTSEATLLLDGDGLATSVMAPPGPPLRPHLTFVMADGERCHVSARHIRDSLYSHSILVHTRLLHATDLGSNDVGWSDPTVLSPTIDALGAEPNRSSQRLVY